MRDAPNFSIVVVCNYLHFAPPNHRKENLSFSMSMDSVEALKRSRRPSLLWKRIRPTYAPALDTADNDPLLPQLPLPNSYWATPMLGSEYPADRSDEITTMKLTALLDVGIRDFYDSTEAEESEPYDVSLRAITTERGWIYEVKKETPS
ncbi:hypothetical protein FRB96_002640 [Tulasnella sp. 330]|nr:hypothetical protein FRB96_002640 [Tulasnella sp. 330]